MEQKDLEKPMQSNGQLCGYSLINGNSRIFKYFAEVNSQKEIEMHREYLRRTENIPEKYKLQFILRKRPNSVLFG